MGCEPIPPSIDVSGQANLSGTLSHENQGVRAAALVVPVCKNQGVTNVDVQEAESSRIDSFAPNFETMRLAQDWQCLSSEHATSKMVITSDARSRTGLKSFRSIWTVSVMTKNCPQRTK